MDMHVVTFPQHLRAMSESFPCAMCWPRIAMTDRCDHKGRPICAKCAQNPNHTCSMPFFVVDSVSEWVN